MNDLDNELDDTFNTENQYQTDEYKRGYDRMQFLEDMLKKEREELEEQFRKEEESKRKKVDDVR